MFQLYKDCLLFSFTFLECFGVGTAYVVAASNNCTSLMVVSNTNISGLFLWTIRSVVMGLSSYSF